MSRTNVGTASARSRPGRLVPGGRTLRTAPGPVQTLVRHVLCQVAQSQTLLRRIEALNESAVRPAAPAEGCCPVPAADPAFHRVVVDHRTVGGTRVSWELAADFAAAGPYEARLQASTSGVADADDWVDVGAPAVDPPYLVDPAQRTYGVTEILHYRVVLVAGDASVYVSEAVRPAATRLAERDLLLVREIARKERLRHAVLAGTPGHLLKARRYGVRCHCVNQFTRERGDSSCPTCYGVGFVGGYHPPVPCTLAELPVFNSRRETQNPVGGAGAEAVTFKARVVPGLPLVQEDVWVADGDDARYAVHRVWAEVVHRGVVVVHAAEFRRIPRADVAYRVPVDPSDAAGCGWGVSAEDGDPEPLCLPETC